MDYIKTVFIGVNFISQDNLMPSQHRLAEVVLIDNTNSSLKPTLYQLKKEAVESNDLIGMPKELISIHKEAFILIGEVESIDKKKKLICLTNQHTVSYNYLILATGTEQVCISTHKEGLLNGFYAFIDAMRIRKISSNFATPYSPCASAKMSRFMSFDSNVIGISQEIQSNIFRKKAGQEISFNSPRRYFYEVFLS